MKTLLLLRHAKSSWKHSNLADHDRPLNKRGKRTAPLVGAILWDQGLVPDLILCSSAVRAQHTAILVAEACSYAGKIEETRKLYLAGPEAYIEVLRQVTDSHTSVLLVGHNPGVEALIEALTGKATAMPTAALAHLNLSIELWRELDISSKSRLVNVWRPRDPG